MNAWSDSTEDGTEWVEVIQIMEKILYKCCTQEHDPQLLILGTNKLVRLLNKHPVRSREEACFQLFHINDVLRKLMLQGMHVSSSLKVYLLSCCKSIFCQNCHLCLYYLDILHCFLLSGGVIYN